MLMTIKNKMMLAMDSLIEEANKKGGVPAEISLEPREAVDFLKEISTLKILCNTHVSIKNANGSETNIHLLLKPELTSERLHTLVKQWYVKTFILSYKDIELKVIPKKLPDRPPDVPIPSPAPGRIIKEGSIGMCDKCGSSLHRKYLFFIDGCIQPECDNYYAK